MYKFNYTFNKMKGIILHALFICTRAIPYLVTSEMRLPSARFSDATYSMCEPSLDDDYIVIAYQDPTTVGGGELRLLKRSVSGSGIPSWSIVNTFHHKSPVPSFGFSCAVSGNKLAVTSPGVGGTKAYIISDSGLELVLDGSTLENNAFATTTTISNSTIISYNNGQNAVYIYNKNLNNKYWTAETNSQVQTVFESIAPEFLTQSDTAFAMVRFYRGYSAFLKDYTTLFTFISNPSGTGGFKAICVHSKTKFASIAYPYQLLEYDTTTREWIEYPDYLDVAQAPLPFYTDNGIDRFRCSSSFIASAQDTKFHIYRYGGSSYNFTTSKNDALVFDSKETVLSDLQGFFVRDKELVLLSTANGTFYSLLLDFSPTNTDDSVWIGIMTGVLIGVVVLTIAFTSIQYYFRKHANPPTTTKSSFIAINPAEPRMNDNLIYW